MAKTMLHLSNPLLRFKKLQLVKKSNLSTKEPFRPVPLILLFRIVPAILLAHSLFMKRLPESLPTAMAIIALTSKRVKNTITLGDIGGKNVGTHAIAAFAEVSITNNLIVMGARDRGSYGLYGGQQKRHSVFIVHTGSTKSIENNAIIFNSDASVKPVMVVDADSAYDYVCFAVDTCIFIINPFSINLCRLRICHSLKISLLCIISSR